MDQERGIFDFRYDQGKEAGIAESIEKLASFLIKDRNEKISFEEALVMAKAILEVE